LSIAENVAIHLVRNSIFYSKVNLTGAHAVVTEVVGVGVSVGVIVGVGVDVGVIVGVGEGGGVAIYLT
jgi:hypothetical protein